MQKKDKEKVFGGEWTEAQLKEFLVAESYDGSDPDYIAVIRAYRHMVPETFTDFITVFKNEGHNLNAKNAAGETILETISGHTLSDSYAKTIQSAL